jgi:hypothetical protein
MAEIRMMTVPFYYLLILLNISSIRPVKQAFFNGWQKDFLWLNGQWTSDGCGFLSRWLAQAVSPPRPQTSG